MSFFGLTSFGPESTIKSKLKNSDGNRVYLTTVKLSLRLIY